jgi:hypothetical protein
LAAHRRARHVSENQKSLLLAVIEATATVYPNKAPKILYDLIDAEDEDTAAAVHEALAGHGRQ